MKIVGEGFLQISQTHQQFIKFKQRKSWPVFAYLILISRDFYDILLPHFLLRVSFNWEDISNRQESNCIFSWKMTRNSDDKVNSCRVFSPNFSNSHRHRRRTSWASYLRKFGNPSIDLEHFACHVTHVTVHTYVRTSMLWKLREWHHYHSCIFRFGYPRCG